MIPVKMIRYINIFVIIFACFVSCILYDSVEASLHAYEFSSTLPSDENVLENTYLELKDVYSKHGLNLTDAPCEERASIEINISHMFKSGTVLTDTVSFEVGQYYAKVDNITNRVSFRGCICKVRPCISKCCPIGYVYNTENVTCQIASTASNYSIENSLHDYKFNFYNLVEPYEGFVNFVYITGNPCKYGKFLLEPNVFPEDANYMQTNGSIWKIDKDDYRMYNYSEYCVEKFLGEEDILNTMICFQAPIELHEFSYVAYPIGMLISVPFLIATFLVYAIVPELRNLHGKSLMCHVISLAIGYTFLAIVQIHNDLPSSLCVSFGFTILFSFLVCFFWLNVMCFDIWWTFSGFRGFRGSKRAAEHKKFILYSAYAWGSPILIIIIALILQFHPSVSDNWVRPRIGDVKCFLHDDALLEYFYGLMLALIICNLGFFIATALKIFRIHKDTAVLKRDDSQRHDSYENDRQRLNLYFKLFVVMGINWSLELISYFTGGPKWLWYVTDIGNTLQGALIFVIFVCKRNVWKLLVKRYHTLTGKPHLGHVSMTRTTGFSTQQSTASQSNGNKFTSIDSSY